MLQYPRVASGWPESENWKESLLLIRLAASGLLLIRLAASGLLLIRLAASGLLLIRLAALAKCDINERCASAPRA
ncbi:hypothetical protein EYF80_051484 [Liparis tanakae]|uniref:Uncharacterized protein n=1 Tax=Liparis tanakae TaxID=230148 RepID=A0A4Z2FBR6_9TELE|nr:hypothetical protein EYF80_051484 [Liparis tanakae]